MFSSLKFTLSTNEDFIVLHGLVVPKGSEVLVGLHKIELPTNEDVLKNFKMLFGIKKKVRAVEEEEIIAVLPKDDEASEVDSVEEDSASEEEIEEDDD